MRSASVPTDPLSAWHPRQVLLFGASTGGTEALRSVLTRLPAEVPGICIVQHIPAGFSRSFANRLNELCRFEVREAVDGDVLCERLALVAPGEFHMELKWCDGQYMVALHQRPPRHYQRPAVDILFESAAPIAGKHAVAALLTGMGRDGAAGLKLLRESGARTFAQDRESSVVYGMPLAAVELGAVDEVVSLDDMPQAVLKALARRQRSEHHPVGTGA